jgi:hypothetical protein
VALPPYRPELIKSKLESSAKTQPNKPLPRQVVEWMKRVMSTPSKLGFAQEAEEKGAPEPQASTEEESSKLLTWRFRGKTFHRDKGVWIDQEYKSEMQEWRCWILTRDSEEYNRVLAKEPMLREFFNNGPVLIVWKNRIYKVLK